MGEPWEWGYQHLWHGQIEWQFLLPRLFVGVHTGGTWGTYRGNMGYIQGEHEYTTVCLYWRFQVLSSNTKTVHAHWTVPFLTFHSTYSESSQAKDDNLSIIPYISRAIRVLRLVSTVGNRTEMLCVLQNLIYKCPSGLAVPLAWTLFSRHFYPLASQRNKHHPWIVAGPWLELH